MNPKVASQSCQMWVVLAADGTLKDPGLMGPFVIYKTACMPVAFATDVALESAIRTVSIFYFDVISTLC